MSCPWLVHWVEVFDVGVEGKDERGERPCDRQQYAEAAALVKCLGKLVVDDGLDDIADYGRDYHEGACDVSDATEHVYVLDCGTGRWGGHWGRYGDCAARDADGAYGDRDGARERGCAQTLVACRDAGENVIVVDWDETLPASFVSLLEYLPLAYDEQDDGGKPDESE